MGANRVLPNGTLTSPSMSIGTCINYCVDLSKKIRYAGLETDDQCWCGAEGAQYDQYGLRGDDECSAPCVGNVNQHCGGEFRIAVFDRKSCLSIS